MLEAYASDKEQITNIIKNYFVNVTKYLNLKIQISDTMKFDNHITIKVIYEENLQLVLKSFELN